MTDRFEPYLMAESLVSGARAELDLTPKPGLVDRYDHGSHPDLDHTRMVRSIELLPRYYHELIEIRSGASRKAAPSLAACIDAGRRAEDRMEEAIGTNAHRGYIFLSGLMLLAACDLAGEDRAGAAGRPPFGGAGGAVVGPSSGGGGNDPVVLPSALRRAMTSVAHQFFTANRPSGTDRPGARVRDTHGLGGIRTEALAGLPSVFEAGLPAYLAARSGFAAFHALAALMRSVEDTTAVLRCGLAGLARLRRDGTALQVLLDRGDDPRPVLRAWNEEYRAQRLTMGGVADCLALVFALAAVRERAVIP
jgi:triphosphoribosyl-dephospho-CoA synthetase